MLRIPLPEDDGFALALQRRGQASLIYRSLVYLGREPVTYRFLPIHCRILSLRKDSTQAPRSYKVVYRGRHGSTCPAVARATPIDTFALISQRIIKP